MQNLLRWLLRRGSPLPIPNREVKPDCADGTAFTWESMSLPFFIKPYSFIWIGFFVLWHDAFDYWYHAVELCQHSTNCAKN